jgi:Mce-associated membrane protein
MDETPSPVTDGTPPPKADEAPSAKAARAGRAGRRGWLSDPLFATALVLVVVAAVFAGWAGSSWYNAANAGPSASAQLRDRVLQAGEQAVLNFNTLDYRKVAQGLALWEQSSTGALHDEITSGRAAFSRQIQQTKTITTARILDGALTSLSANTASLIVAVQVTVTPVKGSPVTKQSRLDGQLTRTSSGWKLSALGQVPVGAAATTGTGSTGG